MIEPSLATLLPNTPIHTFSDLGPLGNVLRDAVDNLLVLFLGPRSLDKSGLRSSRVNKGCRNGFSILWPRSLLPLTMTRLLQAMEQI